MEKLGTPDVLRAITDGLGDWRKLAQPLAARYRVPDLARGAAFASAVAEAAGRAAREPELRLGPGYVDVTLYTLDPADGGRWITAADLALAREISGLAREQGLSAAPHEVTQIEVGLDTADAAAVSPFWSALLTGAPGHVVHEDILDPTDRVPNVWLQPTEAHATPRQRWHFDLWLAPEAVESRIAAALAAGGSVVDDSAAPLFTVLADPDGNKVCICTPLGRE